MKSVDDPTPSGDRQVARLLIAALEAGGHEVGVVSRSRSFAAHPDPTRFAEAEAGARREIERIAARWSSPGGDPPDLWFTYHPYYKAPDLIGPELAARFGLPYVTAEASHAGKRADGPWAAWHASAEAAIKTARLNVCFTARDRDGLAAIVASEARLMILPPFIAGGASPTRPRGGANDEAPVRLVTVAMMRPGDKSRSYQALAEALAALPPRPSWHLTVAGDGPARDAVRRAFAELPPARITWRGELPAAAVAEALAEADVYVWPGFGEAFGLAYLEAAAAGLPSVAMECGGVASVVAHGRTGLLAPEGDGAGFVAALHRLMADRACRLALGREARRVVVEERTVAGAAEVLRDALARVCAPAVGSGA